MSELRKQYLLSLLDLKTEMFIEALLTLNDKDRQWLLAQKNFKA